MTNPELNLALIRQVTQWIHSLTGAFPLHLNNDASSDIGGYKQLTIAAATDAIATSQTVITTADQEIEQWATEPGVPAITFLSTGVMGVHYHSWQSGGAGKKDIRIYFKLYKYAAGPVETLLFTTENSNILPNATAGGGVHANIIETDLLTTDRLVLKLFATPSGVGANPTLSFSIENTTATRVELTAPIGSISGGGLGQLVLDRAALGGATITTYRVVMNAVNEGCGGQFYIGADISPEDDITVTWDLYRVDANADTLTAFLYVGATKSDGSEAYSQTNIENATAAVIAATAAGRSLKYQYTLANAGFEAGDFVWASLQLNEAAREIWCISLNIEYTKA